MVLDSSLGEDPLLIPLFFESNMQKPHEDEPVSASASGPSATIVLQVTVQDQAARMTPAPEIQSELRRRDPLPQDNNNNNCGQQVQQASQSASEAARQASQSASQSIQQAQQSASEAARQASQSASQGIQQAQQQASQSIAQASRSASQAASSASSAVASAQSSASSMISRLNGSMDSIKASASSAQVRLSGKNCNSGEYKAFNLTHFRRERLLLLYRPELQLPPLLVCCTSVLRSSCSRTYNSKVPLLLLDRPFWLPRPRLLKVQLPPSPKLE
jgi:hypothetical protein